MKNIEIRVSIGMCPPSAKGTQTSTEVQSLPDSSFISFGPPFQRMLAPPQQTTLRVFPDVFLSASFLNIDTALLAVAAIVIFEAATSSSKRSR